VIQSAGQRYDLLEPIAAGGMGEVFVGFVYGEHGFQKPVAIKRILPELAHNQEFVIRFVAEAKLAVSLSHANVVQVFDLGRTGDELLLVMEYVRGTDLGHLLAQLSHQQQPIPVAFGVYVALEALKGLVYAHERRDLEGGIGIIHCDVSPSNLLISWAGEVKIGDFGVAQALDVARRKRTTGRVRGKVRYMAPEQLLGEPLDARTDLYSLGVVLYEALTLRRPFDVPDADADAIASAVVAGGQPPLRTLRPDVPEALDQLVMRAMARNPAERPARAREMLAELTRIAQKLEPATAPDVGSWARSSIEGAPADEPSGRRAPTLSATPLRNPTMSFVVRRSVDGVTLLEKESILMPRRRRLALLARLALGAAALVGLFAWRGPGSTQAVTRWRTASPRFTPITHLRTPTPPITPPTNTAPPPPTTPAPHVVRAPSDSRSHRQTALPAPADVPGFVNVYAEPWAYVFVDRKAVGATPLARLPLSPGLHRVQLTNPHARTVERLVRISSAKTELLDVDLDPLP
jgi:serine/threonine protein kinase